MVKGSGHIGSTDLEEKIPQAVSIAEQGPLKNSQQRRRKRYEIKKNVNLLLMAAPGFLLIVVFAYLPMFGIIIAFKNYRADDGILGSAWVGLQNFQYLFGGQEAWHITYNTLFMNAIFIITGLISSLGIALLINEVRDHSKYLPKFYQSALFFPYFVSYVIVGYFVFAFLNGDTGTFNQLLQHLGLHPVDWYSSPQYWPLILTIVNLWKGAGFGSIIYLAAIVAINPEYYEAARIDGASKWRQIRHITLPLLQPVIIIVTLLSIGRIMYADFGLFFQVTRNTALLYPTTDVIDTFVFRSLTSLGDLGMASAAGVYQSVVGFLLVITANWLVRRIDPERALF